MAVICRYRTQIIMKIFWKLPRILCEIILRETSNKFTLSIGHFYYITHNYMIIRMLQFWHSIGLIGFRYEILIINHLNNQNHEKN